MDGRWESLRFPPRHRLSHAALCCCSELEPLFGACRRTQHPRSKNSPHAAPLLPQGRAANWVSWDLLRSPPALRLVGAFLCVTPFGEASSW